MVEQQRLNLAKAASVFEMGPIQQTGLSGEEERRRRGGGGEEERRRDPLSIQADRCVPEVTVCVCVCVCVCVR